MNKNKATEEWINRGKGKNNNAREKIKQGKNKR
jgi:hypothetical protein